MQRLTDKQKRFIEEFKIDQNPKSAAIRAGYSPKNAEKYARKNLENLNTYAAVHNLDSPEQSTNEIAQNQIMMELAKIAFSANNQSVAENALGTKESKSDSIKCTDRLRALELLSKHSGVLNGKNKSETEIPVVIHDDLTE